MVWGILLVVISVRVLVTPRSHNLYPIFAEAARSWRAAEDLYKVSWEPYRYSPAVAVSFIPLSLLPERISGVLWRLLGAAVFLTALRWWCREVLPGTLTRTERAWLFLLVTPLALSNLHNGQANLLVIGLLLAATAAVATERWTLASVCVVVACLFKVYPIAVGLLLMLVRPWRLGCALAAALLVGILVPFLLQRPEYVADQYMRPGSTTWRLKTIGSLSRRNNGIATCTAVYPVGDAYELFSLPGSGTGSGDYDGRAGPGSALAGRSQGTDIASPFWTGLLLDDLAGAGHRVVNLCSARPCGSVAGTPWRRTSRSAGYWSRQTWRSAATEHQPVALAEAAVPGEFRLVAGGSAGFRHALGSALPETGTTALRGLVNVYRTGGPVRPRYLFTIRKA